MEKPWKFGVKVLDGTEDWIDQISQYNRVAIRVPDTLNASIEVPFYCSHAPYVGMMGQNLWHITLVRGGYFAFWGSQTPMTTLNTFTSWLAAQYAAGTPVTVYYPLATAVEEDWPDTTYSVYLPQNQ